MTEEERVRMLQNLVVLAKPELPTLASTPEPISDFINLSTYLSITPSPAPVSAAVHVHVEGVPFQYTLTESDLTVVFSRYGQVRLVHINLDGSSAVVYFHAAAEAQRALLELDGKSLNGIQGHLRVRHVPAASSFSRNGRASPSVDSYDQTYVGCGVNLGVHPGQGANVNGGLVRKYTCRFEIGIENDKEFHIARRLIGPKGAQMKRILLACEGPETPKLRLRGIGSGFLEGALKQESPEPLHLCISCKDYANYRRAVDMVIDLLGAMYREYADYCRIRSLNRPQPSLCYRETPLACPSTVVGCGSAPSPFAPTPSPGFTPQPSPSAADMRAGWAHVAGGMSFPSATPTPPAFHVGHAAGFAVGPPCGFGVAACLTAPPGLPMPGITGSDGSGDEVPLSAEDRREILRLVEERNSCRARGNYDEADRIRDLLRAKGVGLMDEPGGRGRGLDVTTMRFWKSGAASNPGVDIAVRE
jgi:hypothetical protein